MRNKNYILLITAFGLYFGLFNAISITLSFLLAPWFGNDSLTVALIGGSPVVSGMIGVFILGAIQRKSGVFKKWIIICMLGKERLICRFVLSNVIVLSNPPDIQRWSNLLHLSI
jgi:membrane associated rhomboid family serine protease